MYSDKHSAIKPPKPALQPALPSPIIVNIIQYINNNRAIAALLAQPDILLGSEVLTLQISSNITEHLGEQQYNFFSYAGLYSKSYFGDLIRLASNDALNAALAEHPGNVHSHTPLSALLKGKHTPQVYISLVKKVDAEVLSTALITLSLGVSPFMMVLEHLEEEVACAFLAKARPDAINQAAQATYFAPGVMEHIGNNKYSLKTLNRLLEKLSTSTIDTWMTTPTPWAMLPLEHFLYEKKYKFLYEDLFCAIATHTSPNALFEAMNYRHFNPLMNVLSEKIIKNASPKTIDALFSRLNNAQINSLMTNSWSFLGRNALFTMISKTASFSGLAPIDLNSSLNPNLVALIKYLDSSILSTLLEQTVDLHTLFRSAKKYNPNKNIPDDQEEDRISYFEQECNDINKTKILRKSADNPPLLNAMMKKLLQADHRTELPIKALYSLNTDNLVSYLAQDPSLNIELLLQEHAYNRIIDWSYHSLFEARLREAERTLQNIIASALLSFNQLSSNYLPRPLAMYVFYYLGFGITVTEVDKAFVLEENKSIMHRVGYEIDKLPHEVPTLREAYFETSYCFQFGLPTILSYDIARLVLSYLAPYACVFNETMDSIEKIKIEKIKAEDTVSKPMPAPQKTFFNFFKTPKPSINPLNKPAIIGRLSQLDAANLAISNFVARENTILETKTENNTGSKGKTFLEIKQFYQNKANDRMLLHIKTLEEALKVARKEHAKKALVLAVTYFDRPKTKADSWIVTKKRSQFKRLKFEAKQFGFKCLDMQADGTYFFQAIMDQLALHGLEATDPQKLRASAIDHIVNHLQDYQYFIDQYDVDTNRLIAPNIDYKTWATHLAITALSRVLNISLVVIRSDGSSPNIYEHPKPIATLYLGNEIGQRYHSLIENPNYTKRKFLPLHPRPTATEADVEPLSIRLG